MLIAAGARGKDKAVVHGSDTVEWRSAIGIVGIVGAVELL
jgi:hypothetical protein